MAGTKLGSERQAATKLGLSHAEYCEKRDGGLKHCRKCRQWKTVDCFPYKRQVPNVSMLCRQCRHAPPRQLSLLKETPAEYSRRRYATDPAYRYKCKLKAGARCGRVPVPPEGEIALTEMFDGLCAYCPSPASTWDHVVPISKGGLTVPGNIVPACLPCNSRKKDRDINEFLENCKVSMTVRLADALALAYEVGQLS